MINRTILVGRTTKDLELKYSTSNKAFMKFTIAVNRTFGEKETDFINCIIFGTQAENMSKYVSKGNLIGIEGRIQTGSYDKPDGTKVYTTDVVCDSVQFLETKSKEPFVHDYSQGAKQNAQSKIDVTEDNLPF